MTAAVPISRHWVIVLHNGDIVIDWGEGVFQDVISGAFLPTVDQAGSHAIQNDECAWLESSGVIQGYDAAQVYVTHLPMRQRESLE